MVQVKKLLLVGAVAAAVVGAGASSAAAGAFTHSTTGVSINGTYAWMPQGTHNGAFNFYGTLNDTNTSDGNAGKIQVRVEGYGYNTFENAADRSQYWNQYVYDGQALRTDLARAKVCRDRGSLYPDNCSTEKTYNR